MKGFQMRAAGLAGIGAAMLLASGAASAATYCSAAGAHPDGLDVSDVNYSVTGSAPFANSSDCYGVVMGNITGSGDGAPGPDGPPQLNALTWGNGWVLADGTDEAGGAVSLLGGSFTFSLSATGGGATSGTYTLSATDNNGGAAPNFPIGLDLIVALKASDRYALYFFDDVTFDGSGGGQWWIKFVNNGGQIPGISHMTVFVREGDQECCREDVPEPGTLALLGLGLLGLGLSRRKVRV